LMVRATIRRQVRRARTTCTRWRRHSLPGWCGDRQGRARRAGQAGQAWEDTEGVMRRLRIVYAALAVAGLAAVLTASRITIAAGQAGGDRVAIDGDDIGGGVTGAEGGGGGGWGGAGNAGLPTGVGERVGADRGGRDG